MSVRDSGRPSTRRASRSPAPARPGSISRGKTTCRRPSWCQAPAASSSTTMSARPGRAAWRRAWPAAAATTPATPGRSGQARHAVRPGLRHRRAGHRRFRQQLHHVRRQAEGQDRQGQEEEDGQVRRRDGRRGQSAARRTADRRAVVGLGDDDSSGPGAATTISGRQQDQARFPSTPARRSSSAMPKGPGHGCEMQPITPLTNDYAGLKDKIKALQRQRLHQHPGRRVLGHARAVARLSRFRRASRRRGRSTRSWSC